MEPSLLLILQVNKLCMAWGWIIVLIVWVSKYFCTFVYVLYILQTPKSRYKYDSIHGFYSAAYSTKIVLSKNTRLYHICLELQKAHNYLLKECYRKPKIPAKNGQRNPLRMETLQYEVLSKDNECGVLEYQIPNCHICKAKFMKFKLHTWSTMMLSIWLQIRFALIFPLPPWNQPQNNHC